MEWLQPSSSVTSPAPHLWNSPNYSQASWSVTYPEEAFSNPPARYAQFLFSPHSLQKHVSYSNSLKTNILLFIRYSLTPPPMPLNCNLTCELGSYSSLSPWGTFHIAGVQCLFDKLNYQYTKCHLTTKKPKWTCHWMEPLRHFQEPLTIKDIFLLHKGRKSVTKEKLLHRGTVTKYLLWRKLT